MARLDDDLFIVDQVKKGCVLVPKLAVLILVTSLGQHASDEKYNFERLQRETVIEHQRLIQ